MNSAEAPVLRPRLKPDPVATTVETPGPGNALPLADMLHGARATKTTTRADREAPAPRGLANAAAVTTTRPTTTTATATAMTTTATATAITTANEIEIETATTAATNMAIRAMAPASRTTMDRPMAPGTAPLPALELPLALPRGTSLLRARMVATLDTVDTAVMVGLPAQALLLARLPASVRLVCPPALEDPMFRIRSTGVRHRRHLPLHRASHRLRLRAISRRRLLPRALSLHPRYPTNPLLGTGLSVVKKQNNSHRNCRAVWQCTKN